MTLPPLAPVQPSPATAEGFAVVVGRARQKRWQQIGTALCMALLVVASAGLVRDNAATHGLQPTGAVPTPPSKRTAPRDDARRDATATIQAPSATVAAPPARPTREASTPVTKPSPSSALREPARPAVPGDADRLSAPEGCALTQPDWCGVVSARPVDGSLQVTVWLCPPGAQGGTLSFPTEQEVDVAIARGAHEVWRWSVGRTFRGTAHTRTAGAGRCVTWDVWWDEPTTGDYDVTATVTAAEVAGGRYTTSATV